MDKLYIEIFPLIIFTLPILLFIQLYKCIQLIRKEVSCYYYVIIAFYISFFELSQNSQILFLFQFIQLFSPRRTYSRPISNSSYRFSFPKSQLSKFRNLSQLLLLHNSASEFLLKLYSYLYLFRRFLFSNLRS